MHPDTASCVIISSGEDSTTILQGFTLTGGAGTRWTDIGGAGIYREGGGILIESSSPVIRHNLIINNVAINLIAVSSAGGGGIRLGDGNPQILNNVIVFNRGRYGAGIVMNYSGGIIKNNLIAYNSGGQDFGGGGIWLLEDLAGYTKKIINNTIIDNHSTTNGGGIFIWATTAEVRNNIIWGNTAVTSPQIKLLGGGTATAEYNDVEGGFAGTGNIDLDPLFIDTIRYYLGNNSPCFDNGDASAIYNDPEDVLNPGFVLFPSTGTVLNDMGAYGGPAATLLPVQSSILSGINDFTFNSEGLMIYPQPANDYCNIKYPGQFNGRIIFQVYSSTGKRIYTEDLFLHFPTAKLFRVITAGLPKGIYFISVSDNNSRVTGKLLLQ